MPRVIGIDPGTLSFDLVGLEEGRLFLDRTLRTPELARRPERLLELLRRAGPLDLIAGPSGYGLPLRPLVGLEERELRLAWLARPGERGGILGLGRILRALQAARFPVVLTPGVVHLPTVPAHRKANRVDLGTADKVCACVLALRDQTRRLRVAPRTASFILVELGGAFTAVLGVDRGRIVYGAGGTSGPLGFRAGGAMDGEVAYLLGRFGKEVVFAGGAAWIAGAPGITPERLGRRRDAAARAARAALREATAVAVASARVAVGRPREILLSGRLARVDWVARGLRRAFRAAAPRIPVRRVRGFARRATEAAQGAALVADGLAGGTHGELVTALRLREASGTALDQIHLPGAERLRERFA